MQSPMNVKLNFCFVQGSLLADSENPLSAHLDLVEFAHGKIILRPLKTVNQVPC
jgi:hypothetical protein